MSKRAQKDATFRNQSVFMHPKRKTLNTYTANGRTAQRNQLLYNKYNETLKFAKDLLDSPGPHLHNAINIQLINANYRQVWSFGFKIQRVGCAEMF
uniref:Uncharacterized protein n=1 Tax=Haplochromis burtoni TaxID=8153 RepID=A0A3Q3C7Q5_HAPBU